MVHAVANVCMRHIYKVIYEHSDYLVTFDYIKRSNQGHRPFKGLCLINGASYDQSLHEIHIVSHIWPFSYFITFDL